MQQHSVWHAFFFFMTTLESRELIPMHTLHIGFSFCSFVRTPFVEVGGNINVKYLDQRPSDYVEVYSDPWKIKRELNWVAEHADLKESLVNCLEIAHLGTEIVTLLHLSDLLCLIWSVLLFHTLIDPKLNIHPWYYLRNLDWLQTQRKLWEPAHVISVCRCRSTETKLRSMLKTTEPCQFVQEWAFWCGEREIALCSLVWFSRSR